jgi:transposase
MDMSPTYFKLCYEQMPCSQIVIDKFHVIKHVYDAVLEMRTKVKKERSEGLSKVKTEEDKAILRELELLNRCRNRLTQSSDKWSETTKQIMEQVFNKYEKIKTDYFPSQKFKNWYHINNGISDRTEMKNKLWKWYCEVKES